MATYTQTKLANAGRNDPEAQEIVRGIVEDIDIKPVPLLPVVQRAVTLALSALINFPTGLTDDIETPVMLMTIMHVLIGSDISKPNEIFSDQRREIIHRQLATILKLCRQGDERLVRCELEILRRRLR